MSRTWHIIQGIGASLATTLLVASILWTERQYASKVCTAIDIVVASSEEALFLDKKALHAQISAQYDTPIVGQPLKTLKTQPIENIIKANSFVREAVVYKDLQGRVRADVALKHPVARVLCKQADARYIDEQGQLLPLSDHYTARVPIVELNDWPQAKDHLCECTHGQALLTLLCYINRHPFWSAQIAYLQADAQGKVVMYTQVSKQRVEFGFPHDIEKKFAKLLL